MSSLQINYKLENQKRSSNVLGSDGRGNRGRRILQMHTIPTTFDINRWFETLAGPSRIGTVAVGVCCMENGT